MKKKLSGIIKTLLFKTIGKERLVDWVEQSKHPIIEILDGQYGHRLSVKEKVPVDHQNVPLPWFTYPAITFLQSLDLQNKEVLEWGSGNSSLFFANRVKSIISIENDHIWYEHVNRKKLENQQIVLTNLEDYEKKPSEFNKKFDIVIVDGKKRYECALEVPKYLKNDGLVILDNSDWYKNSAKMIRNLGLIQVDFAGFGPINHYVWTTSVFLPESTPLNLIMIFNQLMHQVGLIMCVINLL